MLSEIYIYTTHKGCFGHKEPVVGLVTLGQQVIAFSKDAHPGQHLVTDGSVQQREVLLLGIVASGNVQTANVLQARSNSPLLVVVVGSNV